MPGTMELIQVHRGTVVLEIDGETITLDTGDAAAFSSDYQRACPA